MTHIVAVEARGFIFGAGLALRAVFHSFSLRKPGKLPAPDTKRVV